MYFEHNDTGCKKQKLEFQSICSKHKYQIGVKLQYL